MINYYSFIDSKGKTIKDFISSELIIPNKDQWITVNTIGYRINNIIEEMNFDTWDRYITVYLK